MGFERHTVNLTIHLYYKFLRLSTTHQVTSIHKLRKIINNDNEEPHWLKFLVQAIAYNDATHKKVSDKVAMYKALAHKCKKKIRLSEQHLVDSKECVIAKEINNENLQIKLKDIQTQLANVHMQREDNVAISTDIKYEQLQQQIEDMQSQLANARVRHKDSMATTTNATIITATWRLHDISPIELLSGKIVNDYGP